MWEINIGHENTMEFPAPHISYKAVIYKVRLSDVHS